MSKSSPVSTLQTPNLQAASAKERPSRDGLIIGITCGVVGFLIVVIIFFVVGIKLRRKKKERDDNTYYETSSNSNAQLLEDGDFQNSILQKYSASFDVKKSASCPDIYQVNKSIALKIGPTAHAYEQLEQGSMSGSMRYKSDDYMTSHTTNITTISRSSSKFGKEERDGRVFEDDDNIYHIPSVSNTFRRQSDGRIQPKRRPDELYLISNGNKIPLFLDSKETDNKRDYDEDDYPAYQAPNSNSREVSQIENQCENNETSSTGYQTPTSSSRQVSQIENQHEHDKTSPTGYQIPTSNSPKLIVKYRDGESRERDDSGIFSNGYLTPTSNSPNLYPKPCNITPNQIRTELIANDDDDNIYDTPKFVDPFSPYSIIPTKETMYDGDNEGKHMLEIEARYKVPLNVVPDYTHRSKSIGSSKERTQRPEQRLYQVPSNSQPSLVKTNSELRNYEEIPDFNKHKELNSPDGDMIYDVPSRSHTLDRTTFLRSQSKDNPVYRPNTKPNDIENPNHTYIDIDKLNLNDTYSDIMKNMECKDINMNYERDPTDLDMIYDVPSRCHTIERTSFHRSPSKDNEVNRYHPTTLNSEKHNYMDIEELNRKKKSNLSDEISDRRGSNESNKSNYSNSDSVSLNQDTMYDVPNLGLHSPNTSIDGATYLNVTPATLDKRRSAGLIKKIGYDVPSTTPVFDPSQPSLLKLASKNLYKNMETSSLHSQNKFGVGRSSYEKQVNIPEYDPAQAFSKIPINKKINQGNRSKHFDETDMIYDTPPSNRLVTTELSSDRTSSENKMTSCDIDDSEAIYQNVFHTEDGQPCLRTYKTPNHATSYK